ncbi:DNA transposition protein [Acetobacteraceae bacterium EV16G]|uniref:DNA transposition protein n=1 Tax=Sorlinia euscelidii TaxID=3081148 RepID=A0ABU7TYX1_9PROT
MLEQKINSLSAPPVPGAPSEMAQRLKAHMEEAGLSYAQAAIQTGIPKGTLGSWLSGTYNGVAENIATKAEKYLESLSVRAKLAQMPSEPKFVETPSSIAFRAVFEYAQSGPDIGLITGNAGVGKTLTAEKYVESTPNVWLMTADSSMRSPTAVLRELTEIVDASEKRGPRMMASLIARVKGTRGLIIVDEAQNLQTEAIDLLRTINDRGRIGLVFMGNEPLKGRIEGMGRATSHAQIFSRIGMRKNCPLPKINDIWRVLDAWNIQDEGLRKLCRFIGTKAGGLRGMTKTIRYGFVLAGADGRTVLEQNDIQKAWKSLTGEELQSYRSREG